MLVWHDNIWIPCRLHKFEPFSFLGFFYWHSLWHGSSMCFTCYRIQMWRTCPLKFWDWCTKRCRRWQLTLQKASRSTLVRKTSQSYTLPLKGQVKNCSWLLFSQALFLRFCVVVVCATWPHLLCFHQMSHGNCLSFLCAEGTPFAGGVFRMRLVLGKDFPAAPPKGYFLTKIFHPNVGHKGEICVNVLKRDWKAELGLRHVLLVSFKNSCTQRPFS